MSNSAIEDVYRDPAQVRDTIILARKIFGNKDTSRKEYNDMETALSFAYLYCDDDMRDLVLASLDEAERRKVYFELNVW